MKLYPDLNFTQFPENLDTFKQWLDITSSDGPMVARYMTAVKAGDTALAEQILAEIPSASQKIVRAMDLNKLSQAVQALERFYSTDVKPYIEEKQRLWATYNASFNFVGEWEAGRRYVQRNLVASKSFGKTVIYMATSAPPTGSPPTDTRYWRKITVEGLQGKSGKGLSYRYQWDASAEYLADDGVTYDGALWAAKIPSKGVKPERGSDAWALVMNLSATTYPIQDDEPTTQIAGDLWFNTSPYATEFYYLEKLNNPATSNDIVIGKEAYDSEGRRIVGVRKPTGGSVEWNAGTSVLTWQGGE